MVERVSVEGFDACMKAVEQYKGKEQIFVLFTGSVDPSTGESWCPDCIQAHPVVEEALKDAPDGAVFIECRVGARNYWKDKSNEFRTSDKTRLTAVPTLLQYGTPKRLVEAECANPGLVAMFFEE